MLLVRIELTTSPLPRGCSTTELQQPRRGQRRLRSVLREGAQAAPHRGQHQAMPVIPSQSTAFW